MKFILDFELTDEELNVLKELESCVLYVEMQKLRPRFRNWYDICGKLNKLGLIVFISETDVWGVTDIGSKILKKFEEIKKGF